MLLKAKECQGPGVLGNMDGKPSDVLFIRSCEAMMLSGSLLMDINIELMSVLEMPMDILKLKCIFFMDGNKLDGRKVESLKLGAGWPSILPLKAGD
jgi:hypothetical protein